MPLGARGLYQCGRFGKGLRSIFSGFYDGLNLSNWPSAPLLPESPQKPSLGTTKNRGATMVDCSILQVGGFRWLRGRQPAFRRPRDVGGAAGSRRPGRQLGRHYAGRHDPDDRGQGQQLGV